jgi:hypothetical protein
MDRRWLRLLLGAVCYVVLLWVMDLVFAAMERDLPDHPLMSVIEMLVTILLPSSLVVLGFALATRADQLVVGAVAGCWRLGLELLAMASKHQGAGGGERGEVDGIVAVVLVLSFLSIALGPWLIGRLRR